MVAALFRHVLLLATVVAAILLYAPAAAASQNFPGEVRSTLQLDCTPTCLLCHVTETGGFGTLNDYGKWAAEHRLFLQGPAQYFAEDSQATLEGLDFDGDGITDRDEIIANSTPASDENYAICSDAIYGCGAAQVAPGAAPRVSSWALLAAGVMVAFLLRQVRV